MEETNWEEIRYQVIVRRMGHTFKCAKTKMSGRLLLQNTHILYFTLKGYSLELIW